MSQKFSFIRLLCALRPPLPSLTRPCRHAHHHTQILIHATSHISCSKRRCGGCCGQLVPPSPRSTCRHAHPARHDTVLHAMLPHAASIFLPICPPPPHLFPITVCALTTAVGTSTPCVALMYLAVRMRGRGLMRFQNERYLHCSALVCVPNFCDGR
jgi:hypothetical protein